ncbi:MAG: hypothetical protein JXA67_22520 [Micromonosporaceae bacterium]|nr:hypothetical protein [Micromonosporaceae bacterium]
MATTVDLTRLAEDHAGEVLTLQRAAYATEAQRYRDPHLAPLVETLDEVITQLMSPTVIASACEQAVTPEITEIRLFTGARSQATLGLYERHGCQRQREEPAGTHTLVHLAKPLPPHPAQTED